jgi:hypothetical protein
MDKIPNYYYYYKINNKKKIIHLNDKKERTVIELPVLKGHSGSIIIPNDILKKLHKELLLDVFNNVLNIFILQPKNVKDFIFNKIKLTDNEYYHYDKDSPTTYYKYFVQCEIRNKWKNTWRESELWETKFFNIAIMNNNDGNIKKNNVKKEYNEKIMDIIKEIPGINKSLIDNTKILTICQNDDIKYLCYLNKNNYIFILNLKTGEHSEVVAKKLDFVTTESTTILSDTEILNKITFIKDCLNTDNKQSLEYNSALTIFENTFK